MIRRKTAVSIALAGAAAVLLAACGGTSQSSSSTASSSSGSADSAVQAANAAVTAGQKGNEAEPPSWSGRPPTGKDIWIISCGQIAESCSRPAQAAMEAAQKLGWTAKIVDGKFDPSVAGGLIRQAVAAKAAGIVDVGFDCSTITGPLTQARDAGVPVVASVALDCADPAVKSGPSLLTSPKLIAQYGSLSEYLQAWGALRANWVIAKTNGNAKVILFGASDFPLSQEITKGFKATLASCSGCSVVDEPSYLNADVGAGLQAKAAQSIVAHPTANAIVVDWNSTLTGGVLAAVQQSGRRSSMVVGGGEGMSTDLQLLSEGQIDAVFYFNQDWNGYAAVDDLARLLAGTSQADVLNVAQGNGFTLMDKSNLPTTLPAATGPLPTLTIDFRASYLKAWGVS